MSKLLVATLAAVASIALAGLTPHAAQAQLPAGAPLKVVVTLKPIHALALQVLDGVAAPVLVVDGAASPHTFALKPSDAKLFNDADVVVRVSEALEPFTARVVRSLPKSVQVVTLQDAPGIRTLPRRPGPMFEVHAHGKSPARGGKHNHDPKAAVDGHLWLDPANAKAIIAELARVASAKRPQASAQIAANAAKATARIEALDGELAAQLANIKARPYVVFHDALQYFEQRFGLAPVGSISVDPEVPPSAKRLSDLRARIKTLNAACVFSEPGYESKVVQSVIEGTTAKTGQLDPEGLTVDKGPDAYDALMRRLAAGFRACLAPPA
jgi:zinc transport system substrate-binding protein